MSKPKVLGGRYKLEERVASGGMGTVYIAIDKRLDRRVAVKLLGEHLAHDATYIERFRREARAAAALSHTNIAAVFDYGEDSGAHFIVMELIAAHDLAKILRNEGKLEPSRAVAISAQIAAALGHAHAAGMVHRDVKPANILVGRGDHVKVTDFGIARTAGDMTLTATGSVLGTAHYISPEQASGQSLGAPSDVYSAGIVLFEMLTGAVPFTGESMVAVAMRHANEQVPRPSSLAPDVPGEIDEVVMKATSRDPEARYAEGEELAEALRGIQTTTPSPVAASAAPGATPTEILAEPAGTGFIPFEERWQPQKVGRIVVVSVLALTLVLLLLGAFRFIQGPPTSESDGEATGNEVQTTEAREDSAELFILERDAVIGHDADKVRDELEAEGFDVETLTQDSEAPEETVLDTDPEPGSALEPGQTVTLIVSSGEDDDDDDDDGPGRGKAKGKKNKEREKDD